MTTLRDRILSLRATRKVEAVDCPELGGNVYVRTLSADERDEFEAMVVDDSGKINRNQMLAKVLAFCLCDETGARLFTVSDIPMLGEIDSQVAQRIAEKAKALREPTEKNVGEVEKKSEAIQN